jgi:hypothetical protein
MTRSSAAMFWVLIAWYSAFSPLGANIPGRGGAGGDGGWEAGAGGPASSELVAGSSRACSLGGL